jgi:hemerythrin-like domain-containing protein
MSAALRIIRSEHRSIEAVLHALSFFVDRIWAGNPAPDPRVFRAMLQYIDLFAERLHHPKEDRHLFRRLKQRTHEADALLDIAAGDHVRGADRIRVLDQAFMRYEEGGITHFLGFAQAADAYAKSYRAHMQLEEMQILPIAERVLTAEDWREMDAVFGGRGDPLISPQTAREMTKLFNRIVNIAPAPIGVAAERAVAP